MKDVAYTAYNFVPLIEKVVPSPLDQGMNWEAMAEQERQQRMKDYLTKQETHNGTIELAIENLTPLFVGDGGEEFFAPTGEPIIPGSTLRGMVRNIFKIVTAGSMRCNEDFIDRHLYYRCIMAPKSRPELSELHESYKKRMAEKKDIKKQTSKGKVNAKIDVSIAATGFLYKKVNDSTYYIAPCDHKREEYPSAESCVEWDDIYKRAYVQTGTQKEKKKITYFYNPHWDQRFAVPDAAIQGYRDDKTRRGVDLLIEAEESMAQRKERYQCNALRGEEVRAFFSKADIDYIIPCHYVRIGAQVLFGHSKYFRIPYETPISKKVPAALQTSRTIDFADAVFGRSELWAGRVSFEDAVLQQEPDFAQKATVTPLLGANPTSFQLYLEQKEWPPAHWDSAKAGMIRGYKLYWHRNIGPNDWIDKTGSPDTITKAIRPLAAHNVFTGKIHFRDLTDIELGALLKVFALGNEKQDIVYKLGMGKSLGMGSVRIKTTVRLDEDDRYASLFEGATWKEASETVDAAAFINAFSTYLDESLGENKKDYDQAMKQLAILCDWNMTKIAGWDNRVQAPMENVKNGSLDGGVAAQFTNRYILPTPDEVIK